LDPLYECALPHAAIGFDLPAVYPRLGVRISILSIALEPVSEESMTGPHARPVAIELAYLAGMDRRRSEQTNRACCLPADQRFARV